MKNSVKNGLIFGAGFFACILLMFFVPLLVTGKDLGRQESLAFQRNLALVFLAQKFLFVP